MSGFGRVKVHDLGSTGGDSRDECSCFECKIYRATKPSNWIKLLIFLKIIK